MVRAQAMLLDHLGIETLFSVAGGSMGGMQVLQWAASYPERVFSALPIACATRHSAQNIAFEGIDRVCDLRVEDHATPIDELRRLVGIWTSWEAMRRANRLHEAKDLAAAVVVMREALAETGDDALLLYNLACYESLAGERDDALAHVRRAVALDQSYRALAAQDSDFDPIRDELADL